MGDRGAQTFLHLEFIFEVFPFAANYYFIVPWFKSVLFSLQMSL